MRTIDIIAYLRPKRSKAETHKIRRESQVPCVIYGKGKTLHASVPLILFRPLLQSKEAHFVNINLEGEHVPCILQEVQHHPVSEHILHADFLILTEKPITMRIPLELVGRAPGLLEGGNLQMKMRSLRVKALPQEIPSKIEVDVSALSIGGIIKIKDLPQASYHIEDNPVLPIISMQTPRALRSEAAKEETTTTITTEDNTAKATDQPS